MDSTVLAAVITTGGALAVGGMGILVRRQTLRRLDEQDVNLAQIRHQVTNSHPTNLRDDVDRVLSWLGAIHSDVSGVRTDLRVEREERLALAERLDGRLAAHTHPAREGR